MLLEAVVTPTQSHVSMVQHLWLEWIMSVADCRLKLIICAQTTNRHPRNQMPQHFLFHVAKIHAAVSSYRMYALKCLITAASIIRNNKHYFRDVYCTSHYCQGSNVSTPTEIPVPENMLGSLEFYPNNITKKLFEGICFPVWGLAW